MPKSRIIEECQIDFNREPTKEAKELIGMKVGENGVVLWGIKSTEMYVRCGCNRIFVTSKGRIVGSTKNKPIIGCTECSSKITAERRRRGWIGRVFGRLTVIDDYIKNGETGYVLCKCECYNFHVVSKECLYGHSLSCGCLRRELHRKEAETIGQKFGRLKVLRLSEKRGLVLFYLCECDCGEICEVSAGNLRDGGTRSCGCLHREIASEQMKKYMIGKTGNKHHCWNPNITPEMREQRLRDKKEGRAVGWAKSVYKRDNWTCQKCGKHSRKLNAHHIHNSSSCPELRLCRDNGICFCRDCHVEFHRQYSCFNNTLEQIEEYIGFTPKHLEFDPIYLGM